MHLTSAGLAAAQDEEINPDDPSGYMRRLLHEVPGLSAVARSYADEALRAYNARLYRSSAVMLGVASEPAIVEVAEALAGVMGDTERRRYLELIASRRDNFVRKFEAFRQKLTSYRDRFPRELTDGIDLTMNAVADLLRVDRNDAGHPTGRVLSREDCFINLRMVVRYAKRLYDLNTFLTETIARTP